MFDASMLRASVDGLLQVFTLPSLWMLLAGVLVGGLVGILPGLGGAATLALLLPFVFDQPAGPAFALLIGVISVTATTGDLTSILVGVPGESTAAATVVDGHPMARNGQAGIAIGASLTSSLAGALFGALTLAVAIVVARPLLGVVGSPELFMLAVLGVCCAMPLASSSRLRGLAAGAIGLALATVGLDPISGTPRFTLGQLTLWDGVGLIPASLGLFAIPEIVSLAGRSSIASVVPTTGSTGFIHGVRAAVERWSVVLRSCVIGTAVGLLPGVGASTSQWLAYAQAARRSPEGAAFGSGAVEGVIAPSAANNATLGGALVPMLSLGIPGSLGSAMLLSALMLKGFVPGPQMLAPEADGGHLSFVFSLAWMIVLANVLAVALTWITITWLVKVTEIRSALLVPILLVLVCVGAFAERNLVADLVITVVFGVVGLTLAHFDWPRSPLLIGLVLGSLAESRLFLSIQSYGAAWLMRPGVMIVAVVIAATLVYPALGQRRGMKRAEPEGRASSGEWIVIGVLLALCLVALVSTLAFPSAVALFPRLVLIAATGLLSVLLVSVRRERGMPKAISTPFDQVSIRTVLSVSVFVGLIWAFGFVWGATVAVLAHLMAHERERPGVLLSMAVITYLLLEVGMSRLLQVPFPAGAVLEGARLIGVR